MRGLTSTEIGQYNKVRARHHELELPEVSAEETLVEYKRQNLMTFARIVFKESLEENDREGWACFSPIDRKKHMPEKREIGEAVAFNRALKTPIW